eukprot:TRINITY_DN14656_c0_g1_i1.p1 TRINITY_DN14656_c0_g1~~TRINITY_DN14656_c0_g1_i1.p1  ORF type:complete len:136 (-),score=17.41 TRINITY_DN14656_c0_g1_i1:118-525(-)
MERRIQTTIRHISPAEELHDAVSTNEVAASGKAGLTTHVLDTNLGKPGASMKVTLEGPAVCTSIITNADGRGSFSDRPLAAATYSLTFETEAYLRASNAAVFFPKAVIYFVADGKSTYHIPLLLSSYGYSTYRGS